MNTKQAIDILETMTAEPDEGQEARLDADELDAVLYAIRVLKATPIKIKPKRMTIDKDTVMFEYVPLGKWVFDSEFTELGNPYGTYKCDKCGGHSSNKYPFCFWCGADMREEAST